MGTFKKQMKFQGNGTILYGTIMMDFLSYAFV